MLLCVYLVCRLQDLAARGVSLVYSRGGSGLQQQLLGQLLGLLQGSTATAGGPGTTAAGAAGVKLTGDTKIFEEGQLGNTPGMCVGRESACVHMLVAH
jgi:hypothetical protein